MLRTLAGMSLAVAAGFSFSYVVTLGRLFQSLVIRQRWEFFGDEYAAFRAAGHAKAWYALFLPVGPAVLALVAWLAPGSVNSWVLIGAVLLFPAYYLLLHRPSGFARVEEKLNSGHALDAREVATYLRWNLPLHIVLGLLYAVASFAVLTVGAA